MNIHFENWTIFVTTEYTFANNSGQFCYYYKMESTRHFRRRQESYKGKNANCCNVLQNMDLSSLLNSRTMNPKEKVVQFSLKRTDLYWPEGFRSVLLHVF